MSTTTTPPLLVDPADLAAKVGAEPTDATLLVALRAASKRFRGAVRHQVHRTTETLTVNGAGTRVLRLPVAYVTEVTEVTIDGAPVAHAWDEFGLIERPGGYLWPAGRRNITVTLTHGFDPIPDDIEAAVQEQAEEQYVMLRGLSSKQVGGITTSFKPGVSGAWVEAVDRYAIRRGDRA